MIMNLLACIMILVCVALRFVYMSQGDFKFFAIILSIYLVIFVGGLALAEFKVQKVRTYVNFLDSKFGRGAFIIFLALLILENEVVEIILFIVIAVIGIINMIVGCN